MVLSDFLSRMEGDKSDPYEVIPLSFNSHSTLTGHHYTYFMLPPEKYRVAARSQTKALGTQMPKMNRTDKVVHKAFKSKVQARGEGIPKHIPVISRSVSQPKVIILPLLPRKGQGSAGTRSKTIGPKLQPA